MGEDSKNQRKGIFVKRKGSNAKVRLNNFFFHQLKQGWCEWDGVWCATGGSRVPQTEVWVFHCSLFLSLMCISVDLWTGTVRVRQCQWERPHWSGFPTWKLEVLWLPDFISSELELTGMWHNPGSPLPSSNVKRTHHSPILLEMHERERETPEDVSLDASYSWLSVSWQSVFKSDGVQIQCDNSFKINRITVKSPYLTDLNKTFLPANWRKKIQIINSVVIHSTILFFNLIMDYFNLNASVNSLYSSCINRPSAQIYLDEIQF